MHQHTRAARARKSANMVFASLRILAVGFQKFNLEKEPRSFWKQNNTSFKRVQMCSGKRAPGSGRLELSGSILERTRAKVRSPTDMGKGEGKAPEGAFSDSHRFSLVSLLVLLIGLSRFSPVCIVIPFRPRICSPPFDGLLQRWVSKRWARPPAMVPDVCRFSPV